MSYRTKKTFSVLLRVLQLLVSIVALAIAAWFLDVGAFLDLNGYMVAIAALSILNVFASFYWSTCPPTVVSVMELSQLIAWTIQFVLRAIYALSMCSNFYAAIGVKVNDNGFYEDSTLGNILCAVNAVLVVIGALGALLYLVTYIIHLVRVWKPVKKYGGFSSTLEGHTQVAGQLFLAESLSSPRPNYREVHTSYDPSLSTSSLTDKPFQGDSDNFV